MSREKDPECRAILVRETENAILVIPGNDADSEQWWIPRSQIGYMRKDRDGDVTRVVFTIPEWLIEKKQCWALVP